MDVRLGHSDLHIPMEILDLIVGFVSYDRSSVLSTRVVCKALHECAAKHLLSETSQPAEVFRTGRSDPPDDTLPQDHPGLSPGVVTIWTWIRLPMGRARKTDFTKEFRYKVCAPGRYSPRDYEKPSGDRRSICWGRIKGDRDLVAIGMQFFGEGSLQRYQSSKEAESLREYLNGLWPGSVDASTSTRWLLPRPGRNQDHLRGWTYTEIKTVYFKADMTAEQRARMVKIRTNQARANVTPLPVHQPGPTTWAWLPGFQLRHGQRTVAVMFLLRWRNKALEKSFSHDFGLWIDGEYLYQPELFERQLEAAGRVDQEVCYADFESWP